MLLLSAVFPSVGRDDNCAGEANIVWAATEFVEVQTTASLIRAPFSSTSTFSSPDRIWFGLLSPRVGEKGTMFRPISAGRPCRIEVRFARMDGTSPEQTSLALQEGTIDVEESGLVL
jgi:hypothetical protein